VVQKVLQNLLREQLSVRDLLTILETLADSASFTKDPLVLTEYVRHSLARSITKKYQSEEGELPALMLAFELETTLTKAIQSTEQGSYLSLDPTLGQRLLSELTKAVGTIRAQHVVPILLTSPVLRPHLRRVVEAFLPQLVVLSHNEIAANIRVRNLGVVKV
jgi:flagellar biosynthesis protein FlhA